MVTAPTLSEVLSASELEAYAQPAVDSGEGVYGAFETPNEERQRARFERGFVREAVLVREALDRALAQTLLAAVCACWRRDGVPPTRTGVTNFVRGVPVGEETVATSVTPEAMGILHAVPARDVRAGLDLLVEWGLLDRDPAASCRLHATMDGLELLSGHGDRVAVGLHRTLFGEPVCGALTAALKQYRTRKAEELELKPYRILTDRGIGGIARARPKTLAELAAVPTIGPMTLGTYGEDILAVVAEQRREG